MNKIKLEALKLRKEYKSYREISLMLGVPKSTLSGWFKNDFQSQEVRASLTQVAQQKAYPKLLLMAQANKAKWQHIHESYREEARNTFKNNMLNPLFGAGLAIYWGEGDKKRRNGIVRVSNIDHRMLQIFVQFLVECCGVDRGKIRMYLLLYPDLNEIDCMQFWSQNLELPLEQFTKTQYIIGRHQKTRLEFGVCSVQVYSRKLKEQIIEWINLYYDELYQSAGMV